MQKGTCIDDSEVRPQLLAVDRDAVDGLELVVPAAARCSQASPRRQTHGPGPSADKVGSPDLPALSRIFQNECDLHLDAWPKAYGLVAGTVRLFY